MAERRMFAKTIIDSDAFLDMPLSTQALYFHLSMRGDDDGFINNPKKIQRMIGASDDDMKVLIAKNFIIPFESGVVVIKHWKIHNYIQSDRYKPTVYQEEKKLLNIKKNSTYTLSECEENQMYTECIQNGSNMDTQDRIGKERIGKDSSDIYEQIKDSFNSVCKSFPAVKTLSDTRKKHLKARLNKFTVDDLKVVFEKAEESDFLKGENSSGWKASFDWLINESNMLKVLEGNYDNRKKKSTNKFNDYQQNQYDYESIMDELISNGSRKGDQD